MCSFLKENTLQVSIIILFSYFLYYLKGHNFATGIELFYIEGKHLNQKLVNLIPYICFPNLNFLFLDTRI